MAKKVKLLTFFKAQRATVQGVGTVGLQQSPPVWDTGASFTISLNGTFQLAASDVDGNTLTYTRTGGTAPAEVTVSPQGLVLAANVGFQTYTLLCTVTDGFTPPVEKLFNMVVVSSEAFSLYGDTLVDGALVTLTANAVSFGTHAGRASNNGLPIPKIWDRVNNGLYASVTDSVVVPSGSGYPYTQNSDGNNRKIKFTNTQPRHPAAPWNYRTDDLNTTNPNYGATQKWWSGHLGFPSALGGGNPPVTQRKLYLTGWWRHAGPMNSDTSEPANKFFRVWQNTNGWAGRFSWTWALTQGDAAVPIESITRSNPCVVTLAYNPKDANGADNAYNFWGCQGMTQLNSTVGNYNAKQGVRPYGTRVITLTGVDSTNWPEYTGGGYCSFGTGTTHWAYGKGGWQPELWGRLELYVDLTQDVGDIPGWRGKIEPYINGYKMANSIDDFYWENLFDGESARPDLTGQFCGDRGVNVAMVGQDSGSGITLPTGSNTGPHRTDFGELYFDVTPQRVEIGNASTWAACTQKEIQIPLTWSPTEITVQANPGTLIAGDRYAYVVGPDNVPLSTTGVLIRPSAVSGILADKQQLTVVGSGFGSMDGDAFMYVRGDEPAFVHDAGLHGKAGTLGTLSSGITATRRDEFNYSSNERLRPGRTMSMRRNHRSRTLGDYLPGGFGFASSGEAPNRRKIFFSYWRFFSYETIDWGVTDGVNLKQWYLTGNGTSNNAYGAQDPPAVLAIPGGTTSPWKMASNVNANPGADVSITMYDFIGSASGMNLSETSGVWQRWDFVWEINPTPAVKDGRTAAWVDGIKRCDAPYAVVGNNWDLLPTGWKSLHIGHMDRGFEGSLMDYTDLYCANTEARVEIGNASTYESCTIKEIQLARAVDWTDTQISFTANVGALGSLVGKYVYVVKSDGTVINRGQI